MAKITQEFKAFITSLEKKELEKLVLKAATKYKPFHDYILINYGDQEAGELELFEQVKSDFVTLSYKNYKGRAQELKQAYYLQACNKRINEFSKLCKTKTLELDLILILLDYAFNKSECSFKTCFTKFDHQVNLLLKKAFTVLEKKLHEDLHRDYLPILNAYSKKLNG